MFEIRQIEEFEAVFTSEEDCLKYLAELKWDNGYQCKKCLHTNYCEGKTPYSRRCTRCKYDESATANTVFHKCKLPLKDAFKITFQICQRPDISSYELSNMFNKRQMTCWKLKKKITECIEEKGKFSPVYFKK